MVLETNDTDTSCSEETPPAWYDQFEEFGENHSFVLQFWWPKMKGLKQESASSLGVNATEASY